MKVFSIALAVLAISTVAAAFPRHHHRRCPTYKYKVVRGTSYNAHGLKSTVDRFRYILGGKNNGATPGPLKNGRREINWDGGAPFDMPFDFFNRVVPLGAIYHTKGNIFAISDPVNGHPKDYKFSSLNRAASKQFIAFSEKRLFTSVKDNVLTQFFRVPGTNDKATVSGFGAVYVDVDRRYTSFLTLYDTRGCRIAKVAVPPRNKGLSFVGIVVTGVRHAHYNKAPVFKAVLKLGNAPITSRRYRRHHYPRGRDIVVTDDFIYGEPQKI